MFPRFLAGLAVAAALGLCRTATAAELAGADVTVERSERALDCPDAEQLAQAVLGLWVAPAHGAERLRITVVFDKTANGYTALIESFGAKAGTRRLDAPSATCGSLESAVSVALAVLLDMVPARERATAAPSRARHDPEERIGPPLHLALGLQAGAGFGLLGAAPSGLFAGGLIASREAVSFEAQAFWATLRSVTYDRGFVELGLWGGGLDGCYAFSRRPRRLGWRICGGARFGVLSGEGFSYQENRRERQFWAAVTGSLQLDVPLSRALRFTVTPTFVVPVQEHVFSVRGRGVAYESPSIAGLVLLGPELTIL